MRFGLDVSDWNAVSEFVGWGDFTKGRSQTGEVRGEGEDEEHHRRLVDEVVNNRGELAGALAGMGFDLVPSATNFIFARPPKAAAGVVAALRERKILVRHYDREPIAGWIRITIGTRDQNERLLAALKEVL